MSNQLERERRQLLVEHLELAARPSRYRSTSARRSTRNFTPSGSRLNCLTMRMRGLPSARRSCDSAWRRPARSRRGRPGSPGSRRARRDRTPRPAGPGTTAPLVVEAAVEPRQHRDPLPRGRLAAGTGERVAKGRARQPQIGRRERLRAAPARWCAGASSRTRVPGRAARSGFPSRRVSRACSSLEPARFYGIGAGRRPGDRVMTSPGGRAAAGRRRRNKSSRSIRAGSAGVRHSGAEGTTWARVCFSNGRTSTSRGVRPSGSAWPTTPPGSTRTTCSTISRGCGSSACSRTPKRTGSRSRSWASSRAGNPS